MADPKIDTLVDKLTAAATAYYNGTPLMSDAAYDLLEDELRALDPGNIFFSKVGAPASGSGAWVKVKHGQPMTSLNKAQTQAEFNSWARECGLAQHGGLLTEKLDGLSVSLRYNQGKFVQGLTRGDGTIGEDITSNCVLMQGCLKAVPGQFSGYVRGEIVCTRSDFRTHFQCAGFSNPRNTASGVAKRQSSPEANRNLTILVYKALPDSGFLATKLAEMQWLKAGGFHVPFFAVVKAAAEVGIIYDRYVATTRTTLNYDVDGLVIDIDLASAAEALGDRNGRPKGAIAYKWPQEEKPSILRDIEWQIGNSGRITPVAIFDEVELAGVKVKRASLAGVRQVEHLKLFRDCHILVSRRNEVIPRVEANLDEGVENDL